MRIQLVMVILSLAVYQVSCVAYHRTTKHTTVPTQPTKPTEASKPVAANKLTNPTTKITTTKPPTTAKTTKTTIKPTTTTSTTSTTESPTTTDTTLPPSTSARPSRRRSTARPRPAVAHPRPVFKPFNPFAALFNFNRPAYYNGGKQAEAGAPPAPADPAAAPPMTLEKLQQMLTLLAKIQGGTATLGATAKPAGAAGGLAAAGGGSS